MVKILSSFIPNELVRRIESDPDHLDRIAERRWVTALFVDISGFTPLSEKLDPETLSSVVNALFSRLLSVISRYGGTVDKFLGDAIMVLFGAPVAHQDDPRRALDSALDMCEEVRKFAKSSLARKIKAKIAVSIGVNTGFVVSVLVGNEQRREYTVLGDAINVAARLEQMAGPWEIIVGNATYEITQRLFKFQMLPLLTLKGKSQQQIAWRLLDRKKAVEFHEDEIKIFYDEDVAVAVRQAIKNGSSLSIICYDPTSVHFWSKWIQSHDWDKEIYAVTSFAGEPLGIVREILGQLPQPPDDIEKQDKYISDLSRLMDAKLRDNILLIEGPIQEGTGDVLKRVDFSWISVGTDRFPARSRIYVKPLSKSAFSGAVKKVVGVSKISSKMVIKLRELSGGIRGNLFALLDFLKRRGMLHVSKNRAFLDTDVELPGTISAYVLSEIDSLSPLDRDAVLSASVLGISFPAKVFQSMTGRETPEVFFEREGEITRFKWDFMQMSIYETLTIPTRRRLHYYAAKAWQKYALDMAATRYGDLDEKERKKIALKNISGVLAYHFYNAGMWRQAFENYCESARQSKAVWAFSTARNYYLKAFEIAEKNWRRWRIFDKVVDIAFELGEVYLSLGDIRSAYEVNRWVAHNAQKIGQKGALFAALFRLGMLLAEQGKLSLAEMLYVKALDYADPTSMPDLLLNIASLRMERGKNLQALPILAKALSESRRYGREELVSLILNNIGLTYHRIGRTGRAVRLMRLASVIDERRGELRSLAQTNVNIASVLIETGDIESAIKSLNQALGFFEKTGDRRGYCLALSNLGEAVIKSGQIQHALSIMRKCQRISNQIGDKMLIAETLKNIGQCYIQTDEFDKAERYFSRAKKIFESISDNIGILESNLGLIQVMKKKRQMSIEFVRANLELAEKYYPQIAQKIKEIVYS